MATAHSRQQFWITHQKGTPLRNPTKSGGSPIGVRPPPMLLSRKIKITV